ncbi:MerR family transcriptional regulator [Streptomyces sp. NPDC046203]|uniref:MerR family transcriptional regulator n=1 Tax=Streptomyces sp. NPDC046203 TaxID=3154602 RepID=UPI0033CF1E27
MLLTIGDFARASGLSAKALRRYDETGLLPPARVDPYTGYRYYSPDQVEQARLVRWLRHIGMPLADTGRVCALYAADAAGAARAIRAYWAEVEARTAVRRDLAVSLADRMGGPSTMTHTHTPTHTPTTSSGATSGAGTGPLRFAAAVRLDRGLVRPVQQDAAYAGPCLLAVADGYGPKGERAASAAVAALVAVADGTGGVPGPGPGAAPVRAGDALNALEDGVREANLRVAGSAAGPGAGSGATLTAALLTGNRLTLAHVGDSRAYLLRDGVLQRLTRDHTVVQALVDAGELDPAEAAERPDRAVLLKALDGGDVPPEPEFGVREVRAGDRVLLCTDGLSAVVDAETLGAALGGTSGGVGVEEAVRALVEAARGCGGPDNVACVVADVVVVAAG